MSYNEHLVVVTTYEIADSPGKPDDAVIGSQYWHIGDKAWNNDYHENSRLRMTKQSRGATHLIKRDTTPPLAWLCRIRGAYTSAWSNCCSDLRVYAAIIAAS